MARDPLRRGAQCSRIGCTGLRSALVLPQIYTIFRTTHEHIFCIIFFVISYRFHMCQNFEQDFSESRGFVQKVKHAHYVQDSLCGRQISTNNLTLIFDPFSPAKDPNLAEICNPITRRAVELESYPNHPRIQQVL